MKFDTWMTWTNLVLLLGWAGVFLALPRREGKLRLLISFPVLLGCLGAGLTLYFREYRFNIETLLFLFFALGAIVGGAGLVLSASPARGAMSFTMAVISTGGIFLLLAAPFVMAATIIVYAGAIIVTFLFLLMLARQNGSDLSDQESRDPLLASLAGFLFMATMTNILLDAFPGSTGAVANQLQALVKETIEIGKMNDLQALREKAGAGEGSLLSRYKAAFGGSGYWVERIETDIQKSGRFSFTQAKDLKEVKLALTGLEGIANDFLYDRNFLHPPRIKGHALSTLSGTDPSLPISEIRKDASGKPAMPAENSAFIGRSLFSDYLLSVELAGLLLLAATIGAILIAKNPSARANP
ncbi:MAG: hypothetical protein EXR99_02375 [Gemmataceae bacterium]|nr:hypothetical protein [Gemmataceae bacterium]